MSSRRATRIAESLKTNIGFNVGNGLQGTPFRTNDGVALTGLSAELTRHVRFVVYSYNMPIAYRLVDGTWILPTFARESTPRQNQDILRKALVMTNHTKE